MTVDYTLVRHHRKHDRATTTGGRWVRWLGGAVLVLATVIAGGAIQSWTPDVVREQAPFVRTGVPGAVVDGRTFDVTVLGVRGGTLISVEGATHDTSGIWIVVRLRLTAKRDPLALGYAALIDASGRTYLSSGRFDQPLVGAPPIASRVLQPGIPVTGEIAFEVPVAVAGDLSIECGGDASDQRMDVLTRIRLPIDSTQIAAWRADRQPLTLTGPGGAA
jgi:hypothetical protein